MITAGKSINRKEEYDKIIMAGMQSLAKAIPGKKSMVRAKCLEFFTVDGSVLLLKMSRRRIVKAK